MPAGAWAAAIAGGLGLLWYSRTHSSTSPDPASVDPTATLVGTGGAGAVGDGGYYYPTNGAGDPSATSGSTISTNEQWMNQAFSWLVGQGMSPDVVDKALRDYISGIQLSSQENALVSQALGKFGQTPEGLPDAPPLPTVPHPQTNPVPAHPSPAPVKPNPAPKPAPAAHVYYVVKPGDTLSGIAARYPQAWITWNSIFNNNRGQISNPNLIHPGQRLLIY
jgi:LysM repeat protein